MDRFSNIQVSKTKRLNFETNIDPAKHNKNMRLDRNVNIQMWLRSMKCIHLLDNLIHGNSILPYIEVLYFNGFRSS